MRIANELHWAVVRPPIERPGFPGHLYPAAGAAAVEAPLPLASNRAGKPGIVPGLVQKLPIPLQPLV